MKNLKLFPIAVFVSLLFTIGCNKDDSQPPGLPDNTNNPVANTDSTASDREFAIADLVGTYTGLRYFADSLDSRPRGLGEEYYLYLDTIPASVKVFNHGDGMIEIVIPSLPHFNRIIPMQEDLYYTENVPSIGMNGVYDIRFSKFPHDSLKIDIKFVRYGVRNRGYKNFEYRLSRKRVLDSNFVKIP